MNWNIIIPVIVTAILAGGYLWLEERRRKRERLDYLHQAEIRQIERERVLSALETNMDRVYADNKDLRDRMFQSKAMAPSGVDLTEVYEERKKSDREHKERTQGKHVPPGPLERLTEKWKEKDLKAVDQGIDLTSGKHRAN